MHYLDTSAIVASLTEEVSTKRMRAWLEQPAKASMAISDWTLAEVPNALSLKVRTGALPIRERNEVLSFWRASLVATFARLSVTAADFELAGSFAERHELNLRASDDLHIAVAYASGCTLVTLDKRMAEAAVACGVVIETL
jgi:predicted nucleic acid-binding protein